MSKILVTYFSRTGNTRAVAEAIHGALTGDKVIAPIAEAGDLSGFDLILVGFPVHSHSLPYRVEVFLKKIPAGKRIALFSTHGAFTGSVLAVQAIEYAVTLVSSAKLLGTFSCRGKVSMQALDVLKQDQENESWAEMAATAATHPDVQDLAEAAAFAHRIRSIEDPD